MEKDYSKMTKDELVAELQRKQAGGDLNPVFGVGEKGGVKISGLGQRFPTTLYPQSWLAILDHADELRKFIEDNRKRLSWERK